MMMSHLQESIYLADVVTQVRGRERREEREGKRGGGGREREGGREGGRESAVYNVMYVYNQ